MFVVPKLDPMLDTPLYRQLHEFIRHSIQAGELSIGERLPATRELAGRIGLNRTTVSAAYALLEEEGLISGHVGRGSFVLGPRAYPARPGIDWSRLLRPLEDASQAQTSGSSGIAETISFATSRPSEQLFPLDEFRASCLEVLGDARLPAVLQLGSPSGYEPLRRHLLEEARRRGIARPGDDILITSGCQQAMDLLTRVLVRPGDTVLLEDPVYPGLRSIFSRAGARLAGMPVGPDGVEQEYLERALAMERPKLLVVTPNFQNPTGATLPLAARMTLLRLARGAGAVLVENDIYRLLRYEGEPLPAIKELSDGDDTVYLGSFSKIAFPGLRVGWAIAPRDLIARMVEAKQWTDLHTDQLSQAVLLRFAETGRLDAHVRRIVHAGAERLAAVKEACERYLPPGSSYTRPQGGMNLWVRLPEPLDSGELLPRARRENVNYLPGRYFSVSQRQGNGLRLSFAGLSPDRIRAGLVILGRIFGQEYERARAERRYEPAPALV